MAYSITEIHENLDQMVFDYINEGHLDPKVLRGAYRNEYCSDSRLDLDSATDREMIHTVIAHIEIDRLKGRIYLNSTKTHWITIKQIETFWNNFDQY